MSAGTHAIAGAIASSVSLALTYPLTTITTRQQVGSSKDHKSSLDQLLDSNTWNNLYAGLQPAVLGTLVSQGVYFYFYQASLINKSK
jgi:adenine nucleotide transporter 17